MPGIHWARGWGLATALLVAACGTDVPARPPEAPRSESPALGTERVELPPLHEGMQRYGTLTGGRAREFGFRLEKDQYLHLSVDQLEIDLIVALLGPQSQELLRVDSPTGARGQEHLFLLAEEAGSFALRIEGWGPEETGDYSFLIETLRAATATDRKRAATAAAFSRARSWERLQDLEAASLEYKAAADGWHELAEDSRRAYALYRLGALYSQDPSHRSSAVEPLRTSLELYRQLRDPRQEETVLLHLGELQLALGDLKAASFCFEDGLALAKRRQNPRGRAARLDDLARVRTRQSRFHDAIDLYLQATEILEGIGARDNLGVTRINLGVLYATLGAYRSAAAEYRQALDLLDQDQTESRAVALTKLGDARLWLDGPAAAAQQYEEALELRQRLGDQRGAAVTLNSIGLAQVMANRPQQALRPLKAAVMLFEERREPAAQAVALNNLASAHERLGALGQAKRMFEEALELARLSRHRQAQATALYGIARLASMQGQLKEAETLIEQVIDLVESVRATVRRRDQRSSYLAVRQDYFTFLISILAQRDLREPGRGHADRAFAVSEQARARSLFDALFGDKNTFHRLAAAPLSETQSSATQLVETLMSEINARDLQRRSSGFEPRSAGSGQELEREIGDLLERFRQAESADLQPPPPGLAQPTTVTLDEVRDRLLDDDTLLLEYHLGEKHSYLWAISKTETRFVSTLAGRREIEQAARNAHRWIRDSHHETSEIPTRLALAELSRLVLGPVADLLDHRRLVVVAPGALQLVPFVALPHPSAERGSAPLLVDHTVVHLPSASVLAGLRRRRARLSPFNDQLALIADPVYQAQDDRLLGEAARRAARSRSADSARRLPQAGAEAEAIEQLAEGRLGLVARGFDANRSLLEEGQLRGFRVIHFATHAQFDNQRPDLSAIALSRFTKDGEPIDGYLRTYEIFHLDLPVDLVVLSACRTAFGQEILGEGLVGMAHGFLHAGATRILVSQWAVNDAATSVLMKRFYTGLLTDGLPPAESLRQAQLSMLRDPDWQARAYWAGFALLGDWL